MAEGERIKATTKMQRVPLKRKQTINLMRGAIFLQIEEKHIFRVTKKFVSLIARNLPRVGQSVWRYEAYNSNIPKCSKLKKKMTNKRTSS